MKPEWVLALEELEAYAERHEWPKITEVGHGVLLRRLIDEVEEYETSFRLRYDADMRAIKRWQAAHPGNELVWPDHADMVVWLLEQLEARDVAPA